MLESLWNILAIPLGFIMKYCYIFVNDVLKFPLSYVFALLLFTIITRVMLVPLSIKQQRSSAMMTAFKPMMDEIQKKYSNDRAKQQEEMQRLQQEYGYSPSAGCLPLLIQLPILMGLVRVIYNPLTHILSIPGAVIEAFTKQASTMIESVNTMYVQNSIVELVHKNAGAFSNLSVDGFTSAQVAEYVDKVANFNMSVGSVNLYETPTINPITWAIIFPILSIVTMMVSTVVSTMATGQGKEALSKTIPMTLVTSIMFAVFSFMYPAGFSLYWAMSNLCMMVVTLVVRKIIDPKKISEEIQAKIEAKKRQKRNKTTVKVKDENGCVRELTLKGEELNKMRIQKAREISARMYDEDEAAAILAAKKKAEEEAKAKAITSEDNND